jgi:hypothetical protein
VSGFVLVCVYVCVTMCVYPIKETAFGCSNMNTWPIIAGMQWRIYQLNEKIANMNDINYDR